PNAHSPVISFARLQRRPAVCDTDGFVGRLLIAVPDISSAVLKILSRAGNQDLVCGLAPIALGAVTLPGKVRRRVVNAERILAVVAAQFNRRCLRQHCGKNANHYRAKRTDWSHANCSCFKVFSASISLRPCWSEPVAPARANLKPTAAHWLCKISAM